MKFRFVDQIVSWTPYQRICGIKAVSFEEYSLKEAMGEEPHLPESLLLESFLQLGNWLILLSSDFTRMGVLIRLSRVSFHDYLRPGEQVRMEVILRRHRAADFELSGEGRVQGRSIISGHGCLAVAVPAADYVNPDDLRVLFSELHQPDETMKPPVS
jgi:3-hydroxyacyl-[acyl-carrier-protein] dehydratase